MGTIMPFEFGGQQVRTVPDQDGCLWFVAADVCAVLEIRNSRQALSRLETDETDSVTITDGTPGNPEHATVNESGLYALILRSRKPQAKAFRRWVTGEVLPSIRRTGRYETPAEGVTVPALLSLADESSQAVRRASRELALTLMEDGAPTVTSGFPEPVQRYRARSGVDLPEAVWAVNGEWAELVCDDPPGAHAFASHLLRRTAETGLCLDLVTVTPKVIRFRVRTP